MYRIYTNFLECVVVVVVVVVVCVVLPLTDCGEKEANEAEQSGPLLVSKNDAIVDVLAISKTKERNERRKKAREMSKQP